MTKNEALCLRCGFKWKTKHTSDNPYLENVQCSHCFVVSIVIVEQYKEVLKHLCKLVSPEEVKKFLEFYDYVSRFGYIRNPKSRDAKFRRMMGDLAKSYNCKSLGADK